MQESPIINFNDKESHFKKIDVLSYIEDFIYSFINPKVNNSECESLTGNPELNDLENKFDPNNNDSENPYILDVIIKHFIVNKNFNKAAADHVVVDVSIDIYKFIEAELETMDKSIKDINFKRDTNVLDKIIIEWFKNQKHFSTNLNNILEKEKETAKILNNFLPPSFIQEFFEARGDTKTRKQLLLDNIENIDKAINQTNISQVANYLNLYPSILRKFLESNSSLNYAKKPMEVPRQDVLAMIDNIKTGEALVHILDQYNKKNITKVLPSVFWRLAEGINKEYNVNWYRKIREEYNKSLEQKAIDILGVETIEHIRKFSIKDMRKIGPYLPKIEAALLASSNIIVCRILKCYESSLRNFFDKHKPGWWAKNMKKYQTFTD